MAIDFSQADLGLFAQVFSSEPHSLTNHIQSVGKNKCMHLTVDQKTFSGQPTDRDSNYLQIQK